MEEELYVVLDAAVSFPVAWGTLGEGASTPRAALYRASVTQDQTLDTSGMMAARVNIDCYGVSYAEAVTASRQVRAALDRYKGGTIQGVFFENARDFFDDDAGLLHRVGLTFFVHYHEA